MLMPPKHNLWSNTLEVQEETAAGGNNDKLPCTWNKSVKSQWVCNLENHFVVLMAWPYKQWLGFWWYENQPQLCDLVCYGKCLYNEFVNQFCYFAESPLQLKLHKTFESNLQVLWRSLLKKPSSFVVKAALHAITLLETHSKQPLLDIRIHLCWLDDETLQLILLTTLVTLVADKLKRQWLWECLLWYWRLIG